MAGDWSNLGDASLFQGGSMPASPISSSGLDPDELREMMAARAAQQGTRLGAQMAQQNPITAQPSAVTAGATGGAGAAPAPSGGPPTEFEPAGFNADIAHQAMTGQIAAGKKLTDTADQMQPDPAIAQLEQKKMADEAAAPNPQNYKPGLGTRVLRGLKAAGLGLAEGGIFGAGAGALDPALVRGGTPYGAPTDAYDVALGKNKLQVSADTEALGNAENAFKTAQVLRNAREKGYADSSTAFDKAGTTATTQEGKENDAAKLPIDQENADANKVKAQYETPDGKLKVTQSQVEQRTKLADQMGMAPGFTRTRYILTGEIQPERQATPEEIAANRILATWKQTHGGKEPQTVADWQSIYQAAKGGNNSADDRDLRESASLAERRVKDLTALMGSKGAALWTDQEKQQHQQELTEAQNELAGLQARLQGGQAPANAGAPQGAGAPKPAGRPAGATGQVKNRKTGKMHWVNANTHQDLGEVGE